MITVLVFFCKAVNTGLVNYEWLCSDCYFGILSVIGQ